MIDGHNSLGRRTLLAFTAAAALVAASSVSASAQAPSSALPNLNLPGLGGSLSGAPPAAAIGGSPLVGNGQPPQPQWVKLCSPDPNTKKNVCDVREEVTDDTGQQLLASATVQTTQDDPKMLFIVSVPPGMLLQPGVQITIDTNQPMPLKYTICEPNACFADTDFTADNLKAIRAGKQLTIAAIDESGQQVSMPLSLTGFAKAYDGPGTDANATPGQTTPSAPDALGAILQQRADQARQNLINQQPH